MSEKHVIEYDPGQEEPSADAEDALEERYHAVAAGSPLDMPVATFQAGLDRRGANRKALIAWVRGELVEGVDFGRIEIRGRMSKPSLYKPGAEKICGMLGVIATFPTLHDYENRILAGQALDQLLIRCELLSPGGAVVATGAGSRSVAQDGGDLNKALKMCLKSSMIDATLRLGGLSEVFTQDIEDMPRESFEGGGNSTAAIASGNSTAAIATPDAGVVQVGKHKGKPWSEVPDTYLDWAMDKTTGALRDAACAEFERRLRAQQEHDSRAYEDEGQDIPY